MILLFSTCGASDILCPEIGWWYVVDGGRSAAWEYHLMLTDFLFFSFFSIFRLYIGGVIHESCSKSLSV